MNLEKEVPKEYPYVDKENELVYFNENFIVERFVNAKWSNRNHKYYVALGYEKLTHGDMFIMNVLHLTKGSGIKVLAICPICRISRYIAFEKIARCDHTKCLGCAQIKDLAGQVFGRWSVISFSGRDKHNNAMWVCQCKCGEIREIIGSGLRSGNTMSCGCYNREIVSQIHSGENHYNWDYNKTPEERDSIRDEADKKWAKRIKEIDNYTCQCCGVRGVVLVSHHLNNYSKYVEERTDLNNGITLCQNCHKDFHFNYMSASRIPCNYNDFVNFCELYHPHALFIN